MWIGKRNRLYLLTKRLAIQMKTIIKLICVFILTVSTLFVYAIDPPEVDFPENGKDSISPKQQNFRILFNSGASWARYQFDSSPNFDSEFLHDESYNSTSRALMVDSMRLNTTYYWRARLYNWQKTDSSDWTKTFTVKTTPGNKIRIPLVQTYDAFGFQTIGTYANQLKMDILVDTTNTFDSPYARHTNESLFDQTTYYYKYRTIYLQDTSEWSETKTFFTDFRFDTYLNDQCIDGEIQIRTNVYTGMSGNPDINLKGFTDSTKSKLIFDTSVTNTKLLYVNVQTCEPIFLAYTVSKDQISITHETTYKPCKNTTGQNGYFTFRDSIHIYYQTCTDSFEIQFDTSGLYDINSRITYKDYVIGAERHKPVAYNFPRHPYTYYARIRFHVLGRWTEWNDYEKFLEPFLSIVGSQAYVKDSLYHAMQLSLGFNVLKDYPNYEHEYWLDTSENFNSPRLTKVLLSNTTPYYKIGFFYGNTYAKARLVTSDGVSGWSNTVHKPISTIYKFRYPTQTTHQIPFYNPTTIPQQTEDLIQFEYNTKSSFPKASSLFYVNDYPTGLKNAITYFVRARGVNPLDTSPWSEAIEYKTVNTNTLFHPNRITPTDSTNLKQNINIDFTWKPKAQDLASEYFFVIYVDTVEPKNVVYFKDVTNQQLVNVTGLKPNKNYYWTVISTGTPKIKELITYSLLSTFDIVNVQNEVIEGISLFPNPANGLITIKGLTVDDILEIQIVDLQGKNVMSKETMNSLDIDVSGITPGTYLLKAKLNSGIEFYHQFIKL